METIGEKLKNVLTIEEFNYIEPGRTFRNGSVQYKTKEGDSVHLGLMEGEDLVNYHYVWKYNHYKLKNRVVT